MVRQIVTFLESTSFRFNEEKLNSCNLQVYKFYFTSEMLYDEPIQGCSNFVASRVARKTRRCRQFLATLTRVRVVAVIVIDVIVVAAIVVVVEVVIVVIPFVVVVVVLVGMVVILAAVQAVVCCFRRVHCHICSQRCSPSCYDCRCCCCRNCYR